MVMLLNRKQFRLILLCFFDCRQVLDFWCFFWDGFWVTSQEEISVFLQGSAQLNMAPAAEQSCVPTPGRAPYIRISREPSFFLPFAVILARQTQTTSRQCVWLVPFQVTRVEKDILSLILFWSVDKNPTEITAKICLLLSSVCLYGSRCHKFWTLSTLDSYSHRNPATGVEYFPILFRDMVLTYESWVICLWSLRSLLSSSFMPWLQGFRPQRAWVAPFVPAQTTPCALYVSS